MPVCVADVGEQVQHLRLDRDVERRHRLVQDQHPRLGGQRAGDRDALALAARQPPRQRPRLALVEADQLGELEHAAAALVAEPPRCSRSTSSIEPSHRLARVEARVRVLEDDLHLARRAGGARAPLRAGVRAVAAEARIVPAVGPLEPDDHAGHGRLARARLADDRERAARRRRGTTTSSTATSWPNTLRRPSTSTTASTAQTWRTASGAVDLLGADAAHDAGRRRPQRRARLAAAVLHVRAAGRERAARRAPRTPTAAGPGSPRSRSAVGVDARPGRRPAPRCRGASGSSCSARGGLRLHDLARVHDRRAVADGARRAPGRG